MKVKNVVKYLEELFPLHLASDFDYTKIGLQIGNSDLELTGILLSLDLTEDVVLEAINKNANLIVTHHPFIFNPLQKITFTSSVGKILNLLFKYQISVYVMHTNLDVGLNGVNDSLARRLGFIDYQPKKEDVIPDNFIRYGLIQEQCLISYANFVKKTLNLSGVRVVGNFDKIIRKVAVIGGSGGKISEIDRAIALGCDLLVTGEVSHHSAHYAITNDFSLIEVSHGVEKFVFDDLIVQLQKKFLEIPIYLTNVNTDPFIVI